MIPADRQSRAKALFSDAAELPADQRARFLGDQCHGDAQLHDEVRALLAADARAEGTLREPLYRPTAADTHESPFAAAPLDAGEMPAAIGRYTLVRKIGEGGMGVVYEARQENPSRLVALKLIRPGLVSSQVLRRFQHEAEYLGRLQHPGIAGIYEAGTELVAARGDSPAARYSYFAMEFVRGESLTDFAVARRLSTDARVELIARICDAVHFAHGKGVIHRDLKPANVLVDELGRPRVLDFGVARAADSDRQTTLQTDVGQIIGTLPYMSPEQLAGDPRQIDARADVYGLGVMLYELLAGRLPHDLRNRSLLDAARIIREEEPTRLSSIHAELRGDLDRIAAKALEKDRHRRYASAAELADDLRRYLRNDPIHARPPSAWYQIRKFSRRHRGLVAGLAATLVVLLAGTIVSALLAIRAGRLQDQAEDRARLALRQTYRASLAAAAAALRNQELSAAAESLDAAPAELRGWEWRHLRARAASGFAALENRPGPLTGLSASRDGRTAAWVDEAGHVRIRSAASAEPRPLAPPPGSPVRDVVISPDGALAAFTTRDAQLVVIDVQTARQLWTTSALPIPPAFSPDGAKLAAVEPDASAILLLDARTGEALRRIDASGRRGVGGLAFAPAGDLLIVQEQGPRRDLLDLASGRVIGDVTSWAIALDETASRVAYIDGGKLLIDALPDRRRLAEATLTVGTLRFLGFLPGGMGVLVYGDSGLATVLDAALREIATYPIPRDIAAVQPLPAALHNLLATGGGDLLACDMLAVPRPFLLPHPPRFPAVCAALSADADLCAVAGWGDVRLYDARLGALRWCVFPTRQWITSVAISPDAARVAAGDGRGGLHILPAGAAGSPVSVSLGVDSLFAICWLDPARMVVASAGGELAIVTASGAVEQRVAAAHASPIHCLALSPDGRTLAGGSGDGVDYVDGQAASSGAADSSVRLWDARDLSPLGAPLPAPAPVTALAFSPDGRRLAAVCHVGDGRVWDVATRGPLGPLAGAGRCRALAHHPREPRWLAWGFDGGLRIWQGQSLEPITVLHSGATGVCAIGFDAAGESLVAAGRSAPLCRLETDAANESRAADDQRSAPQPRAAAADATDNQRIAAESRTADSGDSTAAAAEPSAADLGRERFIQLAAARRVAAVMELAMAESAAGAIRADDAIAAPVQAAALAEIDRLGDHLNWLISDAIVRLQQLPPESAALSPAAAESLAVAERKLRAAIARKPDEPAPWTVLGEVRLRQGDAAAALEALRAALQRYEAHGQPVSVRALAWLARAEAALGLVEPARATLRRAEAELQRQPPDAAAREAYAEAARRLAPLLEE